MVNAKHLKIETVHFCYGEKENKRKNVPPYCRVFGFKRIGLSTTHMQNTTLAERGNKAQISRKIPIINIDVRAPSEISQLCLLCFRSEAVNIRDLFHFPSAHFPRAQTLQAVAERTKNENSGIKKYLM